MPENTNTDTAEEVSDSGETVVSEEIVYCHALSIDECATEEC